jgi:hypothetical protein
MRMGHALRRVPALLVAAGLLACGSGSSSADLPSDSTGDDASIVVMDDGGIAFPSTGNQYVDARHCPACHQGPDPQSTGTMSGALQPIPGSFGTGVTLYGPNLTPDPTTGIGSWSDDQITTAILSGIDNQGERLCPEMSHFPGMDSTELQSILGFLRGLPPVVHATTASACPPLKP